MADKKKGPNRTGSGSATDTGPAGKKPTRLLDLKATEVRDTAPAKRETTSDRAKFATGSGTSSTKPATTAATSNLKGAPDDKEGVDQSKSTAASASGIPATGGAPAHTTVAGGGAPGSAAAKSTDSAPSSKSASSDRASGKSGLNSSGGRGQSAATEEPAAAPPPAVRKSGGGLFSTLSHLVAGVIGGGIALFAAEPLSEQFNLPIGRQAEVPAQIEQRIAALEQRPVAAAGAVKPEDVSNLSEAVEAARGRIAELGQVKEQVAALSKEVDALKAAQQEGGRAANAVDGSSGEIPDVSGLGARLDKLENALTTLSSATNSQGGESAIAPLAQFSSKIADLESAVNTQISELRSSLLNEVDGKVAAAAEASSRAAAGTQRIDRELATIKTDTARLEQRAETLKASTDKLGETLRAVSEQAANIKVELDGLKGDVDDQFKKVARPADVEKAITPVAQKIVSIEKDLGGVLESESARKANAERIVLSLQLANLKRVLDRGQPYMNELRDVKKYMGDAIDFSALEAHGDKGVANARELTRQFQDIAYQIINAGEANKDASVMDRLFAGAKSIVQVRRTDEAVASAEGSEAAVARIEKFLKQGDLPKALAEAKKLPESGQQAAKGWIGELEARASVDSAIASVEDQLKASLGGAKSERTEG